MTETRRHATLLLWLFLVLTSVPASAQIDLAGNWASRAHEDQQDRGDGPEPVNYLGLPLNEEGRARALAYSASSLSLPERQCLYYPPHYIVFGPFGLRIWAESDPVTGSVVAWKINGTIDRSVITIWMDGRSHPPEDDVHTFAGFTTGRWEGHTLVSRTTHIKQGYLRRNGVPSSDKTTFSMRLSRHADILTVLVIIEDPVYLSEPHVISRSFQLQPRGAFIPSVAAPCVPEAELPGLQGDGTVPHYLLGQNPFVDEITKLYNIPREAVLGGAETLYPEFRKRLQGTYVAPERCTRYCCALGQGPLPAGMQCIRDGSGRISER